MRRRTTAAILFSAVTMVTVMLLAGHGPWAGRPILTFSSNHGLNTGDLPPLAAWLVAGVCCLNLWHREE